MTEPSAAPPVSLFRRMRPLILCGLAAAALRLALDFARLDAAMYVGVYWVMPIALVVAGMSRIYDDLRWRRLALGMLLVALCCWFVPNSISYTLAQFQGWTHGRFAPDPEHPIPKPESALGTIGIGLAIGAMSAALGGTVWLLFWSTLLVWLPGRVRARRTAAV